MDNKLDDHLLIMQALLYANKEDTDELKKNMTKHDSEFSKIKTVLKQMMVQNSHPSPENID